MIFLGGQDSLFIGDGRELGWLLKWCLIGLKCDYQLPSSYWGKNLYLRPSLHINMDWKRRYCSYLRSDLHVHGIPRVNVASGFSIPGVCDFEVGASIFVLD